MPEANPSTPPLESPLSELRGIGPERARSLDRLGLRTVGDLLLHRPHRYEDRRRFLPIRSLDTLEVATARGRIQTLGVKYFQQRRRSVFLLVLDDGTSRLHCRWWNMPYLESQFAVGQELLVHGRVVDLKPRTIDHPEVELVDDDGEEPSAHMGRMVPIYPLTEGIGQRWLRSRIWWVVRTFAPQVAEPHPGLPRAGLMARSEALQRLHFPEEPEDADHARASLAFDEFVEFQFDIQRRRQRLRTRGIAPPCAGDNRWIRVLLAALGFRLTESQTAVLREIRQDLSRGEPMRRLVQGDVGSGKTVVAAMAALMVLESGHDVALMAPTEILAQQHELRFREWFHPLGIRIALRTGSRKTDSDGTPDGKTSTDRTLTIGTHALLEAGFAPDRLGLVIIDEQHKFGVAQREDLVRKGRYPHLLVMTATPIPRTLALTLYGDLDVSVIEQGPPGRGRIRTFVRGPDALPRIWEFVRREVGLGRQAYVVYSRVDAEEGAGEVKAVTREFARLRDLLAPANLGLLHGRLGADEKERVMQEFRSGSISVLVATSVIEVGVDVANATVMVIENAEQFGLAQLHQLRGRIGRGAAEGFCILVAGRETEESRRRLAILADSSDGFRIAEADLELRGPGELLGQAQSGLPPLRFGDLARDRTILEAARLAVSARLRENPETPPAKDLAR